MSLPRFDLTPFGLAPKDLFPPAVYSASARLLPQVREYVAWRGGQGLTIEGAVGATRVVLRFFKNDRGEVTFVSLCSSCKQVERCVHSAALLTVAHSKRIEIVSEQTTPKKEPSRLSSAHEEWLSRLTSPRIFPTEELRFVITCDSSNTPTLTLYSRGEPLPISKALRQWDVAPESVSTPLRLAAGLLGRDELHRTEVRLDKPGVGALLAAAVQSGLAYWERAEGENIKWSTARRRCSLGWQVLSEKLQIPTVKGDSDVLFRCTPPLYLDLKLLEAGFCHAEVQSELLDEWISGKEVNGDEVESIAKSLSPLKLPLPEKVTQETVSLKPELALSLEGGLFRSYRPEAGSPVIPYLQVSFRYQDFEVDASDQKQVVEFGKGTRWIKIVRDGAYEKQLIAKLVSSGFVKTKVLYPNVNLGNAAHSFTLEGGPLRWHAVIRALRAANLHLTIRPSFPFLVTELGELQWRQEMDGRDARVSVRSGEVDVFELFSNGEVVERESDEEWVVKSKEGELYLVPQAKELSSYLPELFSPATKLLDGTLTVPAVRANEIARCLDDKVWEIIGEQPRLLVQKSESLPTSFLTKVKLRDYQVEGVEWLRRLRASQVGGILADDMGLGKTLQLLTFLRWEKELGSLSSVNPSLIVVPTSLLFNWRQEIEKFYPEFSIATLHGTERKQIYETKGEYEILLISYSLLQRDEEELGKISFHSAVFDEAHYLKNSDTTYARVARGLKAEQKLCLSGTPLENHLGELWSLFDLSVPGLLGDERYFKRSYRTPIEKGEGNDQRRALSRLVAPFLLRRRKDEVARELPEKTEIVHKIPLPQGQRDQYLRLLHQERSRLEKEVGEKGFERCSMLVLEILLRMRQCCCDPRLLKDGEGESGKLDHLIELVTTLVSEGRRILIFSQFTQMLSLIGERLQEMDLPFVQLTGETKDRGWVVDQFQQGRVPVFLISLKAGGTGLNLTTADTVIHYDPWWNPAAEQQASDRAHRIGQKKPVFVYKLIAKDTIEERIAELQLRKKHLAESLFDSHGEAVEWGDVRELLDL